MRVELLPPEIKEAYEKISGHNAEERDYFLQLMWEWLRNTGTVSTITDGHGVTKRTRFMTKQDFEMKMTAAKILSKEYIRDHVPTRDPKPIAVDGEEEGLANLIGPMQTEVKQ